MPLLTSENKYIIISNVTTFIFGIPQLYDSTCLELYNYDVSIATEGL